MRVAFSVVSLKTNPYISLLLSSLEQQGVEVKKLKLWDVLRKKVDVIHVHWPEHYLRKLTKLAHIKLLVKFVLTMFFARLRGVPVLWTVHNVWPHESPVSYGVLKCFLRFWISCVDGCIYMTRQTESEAKRFYPRLASLPGARIHHGDYRAVLDSISKSEARHCMGLPDGAFVISHCGILKEYKNTVELVQAFRQIQDPNLRLIIGGACKDDGLLAGVLAAVSCDQRILFDNRLLSDREMQMYVAASDLVALPYKEVTNSGVALYALSVGRPILGPKMGAFVDLKELLPDWLLLYSGEFNGVALGMAIEEVSNRNFVEGPDLSDFSWSVIAEQTAEFYGSFLSTSDDMKKK